MLGLILFSRLASGDELKLDLPPTPEEGSSEFQCMDSRDCVSRQIRVIDYVRGFVKRADQPKLLVLRGSSKRVFDLIEDKEKGIGHAETFQEFQNLIYNYRAHKAYFSEISSRKTGFLLDKLLRFTEKIAQNQGLKKIYITQHTLSTFTNILSLLMDLERHDVARGFQNKIESVKNRVADVIAAAEANEGDVPKTFDEALTVSVAIRNELYEEFRKVPSTATVPYIIVLEIEGLNDIYLDKFGNKKIVEFEN